MLDISFVYWRKVLNYFLSNSEENSTILFVLDYDTYSGFFDSEADKDEFEKKIQAHVWLNGLGFKSDNTAIALAAHQVLLAYEKIKTYLQDDTDRAINDAISSFYCFKNNQIYNCYCKPI